MGKTVSLKLSVFDRISLEKFLPASTSLDRAIIVKELNEKISFTEKEIQEYSLEGKPVQGALRYTWNNKAENLVKDIEFTTLEKTILKEGLEKLDKEGKIEINANFISLCLKIKEA